MSKYRFIKDSSLEKPRNISKEQFASASYGDVFYYEPINAQARIHHFNGPVIGSDEYNIFKSLKNTINYYSGQDNFFNYENLANKPLTLLSFSSAHLGSGLKKGSISLNAYVSGTLVGTCSDFREDGILYDTNDNKIGGILYREGFILINNTSSLSNNIAPFSSSYSQINDNPKWIYAFCSSSESIHFDIGYQCKNDVPTSTFFVYADKYDLNHSNNHTYIEKDIYDAIYNSSFYREKEDRKVKNTVKSPFQSGSANIEKQTFITGIGLYDEDKKLIGYASLANPVRKTENREFLFKLKIDL